MVRAELIEEIGQYGQFIREINFDALAKDRNQPRSLAERKKDLDESRKRLSRPGPYHRPYSGDCPFILSVGEHDVLALDEKLNKQLVDYMKASIVFLY
jgi:hypothetical protein